jgi:hypothetical protein
MTRLIGAALAVAFVLGLSGSAPAQENVNAILDKGIKALGGEEKLSKVKAASWKSKGTISFGGNDHEFTSEAIVQGLDHFRQIFEGDFGGNKVKGVAVLAGDKGWRSFGDQKMEMDKDALANQKRSVYLQVIPMTLLPLKDKGFKVEAAGEEKVGDKPAVALKVTPPDGKEFTLYLDKESGLPVRFVAKVAGFMGEEFTQDTTFADYKEMDGIKKATKSESKRDGEKFMQVEITEFKVLDKVDPKTFAEPE